MSNVVYTPDLNGPLSYLFSLLSYLSCLTAGQGLPQTSTLITTAAMVALGYGIKKAIPWVKTQIENRTMLDGCVPAFDLLFMKEYNKKSFK